MRKLLPLRCILASLKSKLVDSLYTNDTEVLARLDREIKSATNQIEEIRKAMKEAQRIVSKCTKVSDAIHGFIKAITDMPSDGKYPPYVVACVREYFAEDRIKFILKLKLITSGADFITKKPPFWSNDVRTSYLGGGVVSFILAEKDGRIAASGTVYDVAALDHRIGKEPEQINWKIRPE